MYTGQKIKLREYKKEDISIRLSYINDPEIVNYLVSEVPYPVTMNEEEKWFESISAFKDTYRFAIETLSDKRYIGDCSINSVDWKNSVAGIAIFIGCKEYFGKGYGTDAVKTLLSFIFMQMNINKVRLYVYSFNERAIKCYERCGFKIEGTLRQEIYKDGTYFDTIAMGILRNEFINSVKANTIY